MGSRIGHWILAIGCLLVVAGTAGAAPPEDANYQGRLLDSVGDPLPGPVDIEIGVWDSLSGGARLYREFHQNVGLTDGIFSILIGTGDFQEGAFDADLFAAQNRYLEVIIEGEVLDPRHPFSSVAYALQSGDAQSVGGLPSTSLVTVDNLEATFTSEVSEVSEPQIPAAIARDTEVQVVQTEVALLQAENDSQQGQIAALQSELADMKALLEGVTRHDATLVFERMNLQIVSGSGTTGGAVNGLGNLIIGYNEPRGDGTDERSGSHNLIVGHEQSYGSYGGLVAGEHNSVLAPHASVIGGMSNIASGPGSSVSGGRWNEASGEAASVAGGGGSSFLLGNEAFADYSAILGGIRNHAGDWARVDHTIAQHSSVSGGADNHTRGRYASVSGGVYNVASGSFSSVSGGAGNVASGEGASVAGGGGSAAHGGQSGNEAFADYSAILGGRDNIAGDPDSLDPSIGQYATVSGGYQNTASGENSSVSGGRWNKASGDAASVAGGGGLNDADGNQAFADYSAILGGWRNLAGDPAKLDHSIGQQSSVSGGLSNIASGERSSVSGGYENTASGQESSVSGGDLNTASGQRSSVSGGGNNTASGYAAFVAGGGGWLDSEGNEAFADYSANLGGRRNLAGDPAKLNHLIGQNSSVAGGRENNASGTDSSLSGGYSRSVSGTDDWRGGSYFSTN